MRAIILAAGRGTRIRAFTNSSHKALLKIGKISIIERQVLILQKAGINDILVITGHQHSKIKNELAKHNIKFVHNHNYFNSETLFSLKCAQDYFNDEFVCLYSDLIFDEKILTQLISTNNEICLIVDKSKITFDSHTVHVNNNLVKEFGINLKSMANGQYIGLAKYSKTGSQILRKTLDNFSQKDMKEEVVNALAKIALEYNNVYCIFTNGLQWFNINRIENLAEARLLSTLI